MNNSIARIKEKITSKDYIANGTLSKQYKQCGKPNCRCRKGKEQWHGPYWIWTRKLHGKTITKTLRTDQVTTVKKAIKNMKELNQFLESWRAQSAKEIEEL